MLACLICFAFSTTLCVYDNEEACANVANAKAVNASDFAMYDFGEITDKEIMIQLRTIESIDMVAQNFPKDCSLSIIGDALNPITIEINDGKGLKSVSELHLENIAVVFDISGKDDVEIDVKKLVIKKVIFDKTSKKIEMDVDKEGYSEIDVFSLATCEFDDFLPMKIQGNKMVSKFTFAENSWKFELADENHTTLVFNFGDSDDVPELNFTGRPVLIKKQDGVTDFVRPKIMADNVEIDQSWDQIVDSTPGIIMAENGTLQTTFYSSNLPFKMETTGLSVWKINKPRANDESELRISVPRIFEVFSNITVEFLGEPVILEFAELTFSDNCRLQAPNRYEVKTTEVFTGTYTNIAFKEDIIVGYNGHISFTNSTLKGEVVITSDGKLSLPLLRDFESIDQVVVNIRFDDEPKVPIEVPRAVICSYNMISCPSYAGRVYEVNEQEWELVSKCDTNQENGQTCFFIESNYHQMEIDPPKPATNTNDSNTDGESDDGTAILTVISLGGVAMVVLAVAVIYFMKNKGSDRGHAENVQDWKEDDEGLEDNLIIPDDEEI